jgi:hypothetical protein
MGNLVYRFSHLIAHISFLFPVAGLLALTALALLVAYQPAAAYSVDIPEARSTAELEGVYTPEHNDQFGDYRWTPGNITIHLRPIGGPLRVRVRLSGWRPTNSGNPPITFSLGGRELARVQTSNDLQDVDLYIPRGQALLSNLDLQMDTPTFKFGNDPRDLGVALAGVDVSSGAEWPKPALPNGVVLWQALLGTLLLYGAGRAAGWKSTTALVVAFAASLVFALMLGLDRQRYAQWTWIWLELAALALAAGAYRRRLASFASASAGAIRRGSLPETATARPGDQATDGQAVETAAQATGGLTRFFPAVLVVAALALALMHPLIALLPRDTGNTTNYSWGLSYYSGLPAWLAWGGVALIFLFAIPPVNLRVVGWLSSIKGYVARGNPYVWLAAGGLAAVILLWLLRTRASMGDSSELLDKIAFGSMWREREPLDYYIHFKVAQTLAGLGVTPLAVYQWLSVLSGGLFVVGIVLVACLLAPPGRRWLVAGLGLATGNLLLFAGYVESYTLATLSLVWFLVACLLYVRGSAPAAIPAFVLAVAMWLHPMTAFLLPALLAALWLKSDNWAARVRDALVMLATALAVSAVVATIFLVEGYSWERWQIARSELGGVDPGMFKPLFQISGTHEYYPIFSWAHLGGIIQEQLRLAPLALIICVAVLLASRRRRPGSSPSSRQQAAALTVVAVAAISTFIFSITWNPDLGASNDWDLLSLSGIPLALLAGGLLALRWPADTEGRPRPYATTVVYCGSVLLAVATWHALSWLLANALALPY